MKMTMTLAPLAAGLLLTFNASAQDHSQHQPATQNHSQHQMQVTQDHTQHQPVKPEPKPKPKPKPKPAPSTPEPKAEPMDHSAMGHDMPPEEPATPVDHEAMGHGTPEPAPAEPVDHSAMGHTMPRPADQPITPIPVVTEEDRAAAVPPPDDHPVHDNTIQNFVLLDRLEAFDTDESRGVEWEAQAWIGTDLNKVWLRSEGERIGGITEAADLEVLYGRAIAPWWDLVAGIRHDFEPGDSQDFAAIGVIGLAPYKFEVEATAYIGQSGQAAARFEAEYDTLLTNRLILQSLVELNFYGKADERRGIGSGLSTAEAGVRLRYEIRREFAPYIGIVREWALGRTADFRRDEGEVVNDTRLVAGIRIWF